MNFFVVFDSLEAMKTTEGKTLASYSVSHLLSVNRDVQVATCE